MSPNMKLSVLALVGAAAAVPQYNVGHGHAAAHSKYTPAAGTTGHAYPTGGWGAYNSTAPSAPAQGTGKPTKPTSLPVGEHTTSLPAGEKPSSLPAGEKPTEVVSGYAAESDYTVTSTTTRTVYLTQYPSGSAPTAVNVKDVTSEAVCGGPSIVYVTETNRVTVTVPAGGASSTAEAVKPSVPAAKPSSVAPVASAPAASYEAATSFVLASSEAPKPSSAAYAASSPVAGADAVTSSYAAASSAQQSSAASSAQQSSAAPAASSAAPAGGYTGGKRGLAYRWDGAADCKSFESQNFGFVWNWEADTKGDIGSFAGKFIPTLRTLANAGEWAGKAQAAIEAGTKVLFGFNEPDIASQASMDVGSLCSAWKDNMNPFHGKATIVGPSVSSSVEANQGLSYLQSFVESCPEAKFDDINIHWYGPASAGFSAFKSHYEDAASKFSGKKIWVSEFGLNGATAQESADFLKEAQTFLDGESSCAGYSYFAVGNWDPAANLIGTMSALTEAGKVYVS